MKKKILAIIFGTLLATGVYSQTRLAPPNDFNAQAGRGQAEIIINAQSSDRDVVVWMNGAIVAHVPPKTREKIIVPNGRYTVEAADTTERRGSWNIGKKKDLTVDLNSNRVTVGFSMRYGAILNLTIQETVALGGVQPVPAVPAARPAAVPVPAARPAAIAGGGSIVDAVNNAAAVLTTDLPDQATLAIISIASADKDMADFVIEELAYLMVDTRKFKVVDRKSLDAIMSEQQFQMSGDVDDNSAVTIGKMLGASVVITGSISGSGSIRRLRAKALDVKTAEIMAMASEAF